MTLTDEQIDRLEHDIPDVMDFFMLVMDANVKQAANIYKELRELIQRQDESEKQLRQEIDDLRRQVMKLMEAVAEIKMNQAQHETP